ncbi:MAG: SsrA-binding protein SmpB [Bacteroidetes bacterium]|nr:SsrA-binding protein SmpB [Bacteroidota bacterium]
MSEKKIVIKNKKAGFEYFIETVFDAGIILKGTEVKSIRGANANINDAYCVVENDKVVIKNMHIAEYKNTGFLHHKPDAARQLLLKKNEIKKIKEKLKNIGYALVPLELYFSETGFAKLKIGIAKGKKHFDKREDIKKKDIERDIARFK